MQALKTLALKDLCWQDVPGGSLAYRPRKDAPQEPLRAVAVLGAFDGLHRGHRKLVEQAVHDAQDQHVPCVAITFDPDPSEVVESGSFGRRLLSLDDRVGGLLRMGVDYVVAYSFTQGLMAMDPLAFIDQALLPVVRPTSVHVGSNYRFGHKGSGDGTTLRQAGETRGFSTHVHSLLSISGEDVSATRIRTLLKEGQLALANELLDRCHYVRGTVEHGRGEATSFGFPTANVRCDHRACLPAEGVYACYVSCDGYAWPAAANVGAPPTFAAHDSAFLEANLLGFEGNLYNRDVTVSFVQWLRASRKFDSIEELERVVLGNIDWVRDNLGQSRIEVSD